MVAVARACFNILPVKPSCPLDINRCLMSSSRISTPRSFNISRSPSMARAKIRVVSSTVLVPADHSEKAPASPTTFVVMSAASARVNSIGTNKSAKPAAIPSKLIAVRPKAPAVSFDHSCIIGNCSPNTTAVLLCTSSSLAPCSIAFLVADAKAAPIAAIASAPAAAPTLTPVIEPFKSFNAFIAFPASASIPTAMLLLRNAI